MDTLNLSNPTAESIKEAMDPMVSTMYGRQTGGPEPPSTRFLRIPNVSAAVFADLDGMELGGRLTYDFETHDLVIRIIPFPHESSHISLAFCIRGELIDSFGVPYEDISLLGAAKFTGDSGKRATEPDFSIRPSPERRMEDTPPTLVIEAGVAEGARYLREDAVWWLSCFQPCVNVVILVILDLTARSMRLEVWKRREGEPVIVSKADLTPTGDIYDTYRGSQDLRLCFEDIMLRPSPREETEIVLTKEELASLAQYKFQDVRRQEFW